MCPSHYARWLRYGDALAGRTFRGELPKWIEQHKSYTGEDCLKWPFGTDGSGYGSCSTIAGENKAHRIMCALVHGPAPTPSHEAAHSCGKGHEGCVNPRHLRWATRSENMADRIEHGGGNRGSRHGMSKLNEETVRAIRSLQSEHPQTTLARMFGVSQPLINAVIHRKRWDWLD